MKKLFDAFICIVSLIMIAFIPTSNNYILFGKGYTIFVWSAVLVILFICALRHKVVYKNLLIFDLACCVYLIIVTFLANIKYENLHISLARIIPILSLLFLTNFRVRNVKNKKLTVILLNIFSLSCIIWNMGIILREPNILKFTYKYFSQYFRYATYYSVIERSKPVMSFGVHTYAAYFYFLFFILNIFTYQYIKKKIYLIYCIFFMIFTLFLVSTTAIIFFVLMSFWLFKILVKEKKRILMYIIIILLLYICFRYFNFLYNKIYLNMTNGQNSFVSRYSDKTVFKNNIEIILSSLGIGFTILDELTLGYSDSGYVVYLTMGNFPLMLYVYLKIYIFLKANIFGEKLFPVLIVIFLFEFALPASLSYRFPFMILYLIYHLQSLERE